MTVNVESIGDQIKQFNYYYLTTSVVFCMKCLRELCMEMIKLHCCYGNYRRSLSSDC